MSHAWGAHNEAACDYLNRGGKWPDWVITTAFYSASKYIQGSLFPLSENGATHQSFSEYLKAVHGGQRCDKHEMPGTLTYQHLPGAYDSYRFLKDQAKTARYKNHHVHPDIVAKARQHPGTIKAIALGAATP